MIPFAKGITFFDVDSDNTDVLSLRGDMIGWIVTRGERVIELHPVVPPTVAQVPLVHTRHGTSTPRDSWETLGFEVPASICSVTLTSVVEIVVFTTLE
jgi:hypothetical protein